jgi:ASC-1-like (ASCH) protein
MPNTIVMRLDRKPFDLVKAEKKIWEIRLNDEKRQGISVGDTIVFMRRPELEERCEVQVVEKIFFSDMQRLLNAIPRSEFGCEGISELEYIQGFLAHYRPEEVVRFGIVAFKIKKM